jgi:hypothetical protein
MESHYFESRAGRSSIAETLKTMRRNLRDRVDHHDLDVWGI